MPVTLWAFIMPSRWVVVIPRVVSMALTSYSVSAVPPAPAPSAAADIPDDPAAARFAEIMSYARLKSWSACCFASVLPTQGCCPDLRWVPLPNLFHALSPDLFRAFSPDL